MKYLIGKRTNYDRKNKCYEVEKIITRKSKYGKNFYLIKWEGYPISECTWEPISHLSNVRDMVEEFDKDFPNSINQKLLKEFLIEYRSFEYLKYLQKKKMKILKKRKLKTSNPNKFIIPLDNDEIEEDHEEEETESKENTNITINVNNSEDNCYNAKNPGKLIKPIIIW